MANEEMMADEKQSDCRVICTLLAASGEISGVRFVTAPIGKRRVKVSERIEQKTAASFLKIDGFEAYEDDPESEEAIELAFKQARERALAGEGDSDLAVALRTVNELTKANQAMQEEIRLLKQQLGEAEKPAEPEKPKKPKKKAAKKAVEEDTESSGNDEGDSDSDEDGNDGGGSGDEEQDSPTQPAKTGDKAKRIGRIR